MGLEWRVKLGEVKSNHILDIFQRSSLGKLLRV